MLRPDALIRTPSQRTFGGNGIYNTTGGGQSRSAKLDRGRSARFYVRVENDGNTRADIRVVGTKESANFAVRYYLGSRQVSPIVKDGTLVFRDLAPGARRTLTVEVQARRGAQLGATRRVVVSARAAANLRIRDNVVVHVKIPAFTPQQRRIAELINQSRRQNGRRPLALHRQLTRKAQGWAEHMARQGRLSHSNLSSGVPPGWRAIAENVGMGGSIVQVHNAFLRSGGHRRNMLGHFTHVGTGHAVRGSRVFVCQVFMLR